MRYLLFCAVLMTANIAFSSRDAVSPFASCGAMEFGALFTIPGSVILHLIHYEAARRIDRPLTHHDGCDIAAVAGEVILSGMGAINCMDMALEGSVTASRLGLAAVEILGAVAIVRGNIARKKLLPLSLNQEMARNHNNIYKISAEIREDLKEKRINQKTQSALLASLMIRDMDQKAQACR